MENQYVVFKIEPFSGDHIRCGFYNTLLDAVADVEWWEENGMGKFAIYKTKCKG